MADSARSANVGVGTLYRRFPHREALLRAVAHTRYRRAVREMHAAEDEEPTAWDARARLIRLCRRPHVSVQGY
ncbi:TetR family transcriptional regulator [Amycolatopsis methanolica]|uniref:TetR family transcriptional regulator n=1 Tax=Amycolatopsis methanolica TaxID=1814 RepID=UPI000AAD01EF|nr:TetR family transcriptional regulator [Amycolatopsis methanolica]